MRVFDLDLEVYQGPFDLLLSLVLKEEVDLLEVPLVDVILAYLDHTRPMESAEAVVYWDEMTEFLLLMSLLVEVKSRLLLPAATGDAPDVVTPEEAREQFLLRLFRYHKFKAAADGLRSLGEANYGALMRPPAAGRSRRPAPLDEVAGTGDVTELRGRLNRLLEGRRQPDDSHVAQVRVDLQRQIKTIKRALARRGRFSFNSVFGGEERLVQAVSLLALLELLSRGEVHASQREFFGDILVRSTPQNARAQRSA